MRRLEVGIVGEGEFDQLVERLGMKQRPPISGNVAPFGKVLGFPASDIRRGDGVRDWMVDIIVYGRNRRTLKVWPHRTAGHQQAGQARKEKQNTRCLKISDHLTLPIFAEPAHMFLVENSTSPILKFFMSTRLLNVPKIPCPKALHRNNSG
jgi:hypothetical protein